MASVNSQIDFITCVSNLTLSNLVNLQPTYTIIIQIWTLLAVSNTLATRVKFNSEFFLNSNSEL